MRKTIRTSIRWLEDLIRDARHGLFAFRRAPLYTTVILLTLALGIGATTTIFSVMSASMLRSLPFPDPDGVVEVRLVDPHEFGIRMALGAQLSNILRMVMREGLLLTLIGIALGIGGAVLLTRLLLIELPLFQITPTDPPTLLSVALFLVAVALAACYIPARRVHNTDILNTLRAE